MPSSGRTCKIRPKLSSDYISHIEAFLVQIRQGLPCNIITYGSLIQAAEQRGKWQLALWFFDRMQHDDIMPNTMTFNALLSACAQGIHTWSLGTKTFKCPYASLGVHWRFLQVMCQEDWALMKARPSNLPGPRHIEARNIFITSTNFS